jgi:hypothetical protein
MRSGSGTLCAWLFLLFLVAAPGDLLGQTPVPNRLDGEPYFRLLGTRASVHFVEADEFVAVEVLSALDSQLPLPGLGPDVPNAVRVVLAHSPEAFDELTGGAVPEWRAGVAIPSENLIVVPTGEGRRILSPDGRRTLRHEWAHLGLAQALDGLRAPRWFNEGYAQWASGGFDALEAWQLRVLLATGRAPPMDSLTLRWPAGRAEANIAYLLSASAVTHLLSNSGARGMAIFIERWKAERSFETAFRRVFGRTTGQFEEDWRKHVKDEYGWLFVLSHSTVFWMVLALVLLFMVRIRRGDNREKLARLRAGELPDQPAYWQTDAGDDADARTGSDADASARSGRTPPSVG